jgi:O-antigen/teichoic acid export membrane protein
VRFRNKVITGAIWVSIDGWGRQIASLVVFAVLARLLDPVEIGLFAMVLIVLAALQTVLDEGLTEVIVQRPTLEQGHLDTAFVLSVVASTVLAGGTMLAAPGIAALFGQPTIAPMIAVAAVAPFLAGVFGVHQGLLRRRLDYRTLARRSGVGVIGGGIVGIVMAFDGWGAWAMVGQQIADRLLGGLVLAFGTGWRPGGQVRLAHLGDLVPFSGYLATTRIVNFTSKQVDRYLIGVMMGPATLGLYNVALRVSDTAYALLAQGLAGVGMSAFSRLEGDRARLRTALIDASETANLFAFPAFFGLSAVASVLVVVMFGPQWADSGSLLTILALLGIPAMFSTFAGALMRALAKTRLLLTLLVVSAVANILVVLATVPYGLTAVATGILVRNLCFIPIHLWVQHHLVGLSPQDHLARMLPILAASVGMAVAVLGVRALVADHLPAWATLALLVGVGAAVYPLLLLAVARNAMDRVRITIIAYRERVTVG